MQNMHHSGPVGRVVVLGKVGGTTGDVDGDANGVTPTMPRRRDRTTYAGGGDSGGGDRATDEDGDVMSPAGASATLRPPALLGQTGPPWGIISAACGGWARASRGPHTSAWRVAVRGGGGTPRGVGGGVAGDVNRAGAVSWSEVRCDRRNMRESTPAMSLRSAVRDVGAGPWAPQGAAVRAMGGPVPHAARSGWAWWGGRDAPLRAAVAGTWP